jgi:hypothetical protein
MSIEKNKRVALASNKFPKINEYFLSLFFDSGWIYYAQQIISKLKLLRPLIVFDRLAYQSRISGGCIMAQIIKKLFGRA